MPIDSDANSIVGLEYSEVVTTFPVPEEHPPSCVSRSQKLPIRRKRSLNRISCTL